MANNVCVARRLSAVELRKSDVNLALDRALSSSAAVSSAFKTSSGSRSRTLAMARTLSASSGAARMKVMYTTKVVRPALRESRRSLHARLSRRDRRLVHRDGLGFDVAHRNARRGSGPC